MDCPTSSVAAGELSLASSLEMIDRAASFLGVTVISSTPASDAAMSEPSAVQAAVASAVTIGIRKSCEPVCTTVAICIATDAFSTGWTTSAPTSSGVRMPSALEVSSAMGVAFQVGCTTVR
ncbi:Uncharacterised protein [Mycobacteroides abscessus subsp. bolletii]|nr:Uncharacterised protein [Mycobacteroides abscessus subsp. bolletii]